MSTINRFLTEHASSTQLALYGGVMASLWLIELIVASDGFKGKWAHTRLNFLFIVTSLPVQLLLTVLVLAASVWVTAHHWGLLYLLPYSSSIWVKYVLGFIVLDFLEYVYHVTMHKCGGLWRFHLIHHCDLTLDVSTTVREHPGETFARVCYLILWVGFTGASFGLLLLRQTFQTVCNIIAHSAHRYPEKVDRVLRLVFITPNLHHVHHHREQPHTDCNYGDIFSFWDRIFGTYSQLPSAETEFGLDTHIDRSFNGNFWKMVILPFKRKSAPTKPDLL